MFESLKVFLIRFLWYSQVKQPSVHILIIPFYKFYIAKDFVEMCERVRELATYYTAMIMEHVPGLANMQL